MDERTWAAILIGGVYPLMIAIVAGIFVLLLEWSEKSRSSSKRSIEQRIRK